MAQLYIGWPAGSEPGQQQPVRQLRGFSKVALQPNASEEVVFSLSPTDVQVWDATAAPAAWSVIPGVYSFWIGSSSRDLRLTGSFTVSV